MCHIKLFLARSFWRNSRSYPVFFHVKSQLYLLSKGLPTNSAQMVLDAKVQVLVPLEVSLVICSIRTKFTYKILDLVVLDIDVVFEVFLA